MSWKSPESERAFLRAPGYKAGFRGGHKREGRRVEKEVGRAGAREAMVAVVETVFKHRGAVFPFGLPS